MRAFVAVVVALVIGIAAGFGAGYAVGDNNHPHRSVVTRQAPTDVGCQNPTDRLINGC